MGDMTAEFVKLIKSDIKEKFDTTSDILDILTINPETVLLYSILYLQEGFEYPFLNCDSQPFNNSAQKFDYFGLMNNSKVSESDKYDILSQIGVLYHNNDDDFACAIETTNEFTFVFNRTNSKLSFQENYNNIKEQTENAEYDYSINQFLFPNISFSEMKTFNSLMKTYIIDPSNMYEIGMALQTIKFELNKVGATLKSEAVIVSKEGACFVEPPPPKKIKDVDLIFDKSFYLYLLDGNTPIFAIRVENLDIFQ